MSESTLIELDQFEQLKELMGDEFDMLVEIYQKNSQKLLSDMQDAFVSSDAKLGRISAHSLKSSSASFGLLSLCEQAKKIEEAWYEGVTPSDEDMDLIEQMLKGSLNAINLAMIDKD
ncbi:hypothetical protein NBRC116583_32960 [Arenicella sp. 4NH20-0111]|uniref:Hpt domain-containing protein n=1 Tax=Arenicella sp. 4NH20-0111 TaxID=3127648 RepID=UPI0031033831